MEEVVECESTTKEMTGKIIRLRIDDTDIFLEEIGENKGKITISNTYGYNYSNYWGAMGGTLKEFICRINKEYFADKLLGSASNSVMDVKATFKEIRRYISKDMGLPWYKHMEFQKDMREVLNRFQEQMEENPSENYFVDSFYNKFIDRLSFYLIVKSYDQEQIEEDFKSISEPWHFIQGKDSPRYIWLKELHGKLKNELLKQK